jgi:hypothetical protein
MFIKVSRKKVSMQGIACNQKTKRFCDLSDQSSAFPVGKSLLVRFRKEMRKPKIGHEREPRLTNLSGSREFGMPLAKNTLLKITADNAKTATFQYCILRHLSAEFYLIRLAVLKRSQTDRTTASGRQKNGVSAFGVTPRRKGNA